MRALVFENNTLSFNPRRPEPRRDDGDCLIRVRRAGICATDLEITRGYMGFTGILGHEFVGEVVEAPSARHLVGRRVVGDINVVCGRCDLCVSGLSNHCRNRTVLGILRRDGAFADHVRLPVLFDANDLRPLDVVAEIVIDPTSDDIDVDVYEAARNGDGAAVSVEPDGPGSRR